jgi:hypothetical protein
MSFSQSDMNSNDSLIYTPQYLFEMMIADLEQCDLDRIELKKAKAELSLIYVELAKANKSKEIAFDQMKDLREYNDSLVNQNLNMTIENQRSQDKLKRSRNWWRAGTFAGFLTAIGVHFNWKESWVNVR